MALFERWPDVPRRSQSSIHAHRVPAFVMNDAIRQSLQAALGSGYTLGREIGGGGMSRVYVARDEALGRDVVVKVLSPTLAQEFSVERFTREIRLAANLQHAHIVPLLSAGATTDGLPYYLMPFVEGESLRHRMAAGTGLPIDEVVLVLNDVSRALAYAHARGVVHRDIKPDNVMLSGGAAVVTDFGIAKAVTSARVDAAPAGDSDDSLTRMGTSLGTPAYMAPEQGAGDPDTDHRADIYALGAMAYELLTGVTPFGQRPPHALLVAHFTETPAPIETRRPDVPPALAALVMRCLAKDPAQRPQTAADVLASLGDLAATGATTGPAAARAPIAATTSAPRRFPSRTLAISLVSTLVLGAAAFAGWRHLRVDPGTDATLIAVMPFNVRDQALTVWREGLVDVLSRSLDGAGPLRTVAPSTVIGKAPGRSDAASATTLGRNVGAGLVLFGDLGAIGRDSVHLRAAIYDVAAGEVRQDFDVRGESSRMDALADSLSLRVLRELSGTSTIGGARLYSVGTRSLPALKAFLQGQQLYRRTLGDSALAAYREAVEYDSTFALAWRGVASHYIRNGRENEPAAQHALDQAIKYKSGRSPRDSMLLRADSLRLAFVRRQPGQVDALDPIPILPPLFATLNEAVRQYPSDAELWYELGDANYHFGEFAGMPQGAALAAFDRGIALDSSFAMPYFHASDLALRDGRTALAARYATRLAKISAQLSPYYRLTAAVLDSPPPFSREARRLIDSMPGSYTAAVIGQLYTSPDSLGVAMALARLVQERPAPVKEPVDSSSLRDAVSYALAARGRFRDALASRGGPVQAGLYFQLARLGAVSRDSAVDRARRWSRSEPQRALGAQRLLAESRDTASLGALIRWADSVESAPSTGAANRPPVRYSPLLRAYQTLARGDSAGALRAFLSLPMSGCNGIPCAGGVVGALLANAGREQEAARVLDRWMPSTSGSITAPQEWLLRARLAEKLGDEERAVAAYRRVVTLWSGGDEPVQAALTEAKDGLRRMSGR